MRGVYVSVDATDGLMATLGLKLVNVIVAAVVSFVSLRFFDELKTADKWSTFIGGWAVAVWGADPLADFFGLPEKIAIGLVILLALFGMAFAAEVIKIIRTTEWGLLIKEFFEALMKLVGRGK